MVAVYAAGYMIGELLAKQGHRNIAYVGFAPAYPDRERMRGLTDCFAVHQLALTRFEVLRPTIAEGERVCSSIVLRKDKPDAVVCYNDLVAIGFMGVARLLGISIPADLSVVGIDNIPFGRFTSPALTTIDTQSELLGEEGMRMLFRQIAGGGPDTGHTMIEPRLVLRDSTMARRAPSSPPGVPKTRKRPRSRASR